MVGRRMSNCPVFQGLKPFLGRGTSGAKSRRGPISQTGYPRSDHLPPTHHLFGRMRICHALRLCSQAGYPTVGEVAVLLAHTAPSPGLPNYTCCTLPNAPYASYLLQAVDMSSTPSCIDNPLSHMV